jgi:hypothetical protein
MQHLEHCKSAAIVDLALRHGFASWDIAASSSWERDKPRWGELWKPPWPSLCVINSYTSLYQQLVSPSLLHIYWSCFLHPCIECLIFCPRQVNCCFSCHTSQLCVVHLCTLLRQETVPSSTWIIFLQNLLRIEYQSCKFGPSPTCRQAASQRALIEVMRIIIKSAVRFSASYTFKISQGGENPCWAADGKPLWPSFLTSALSFLIFRLCNLRQTFQIFKLWFCSLGSHASLNCRVSAFSSDIQASLPPCFMMQHARDHAYEPNLYSRVQILQRWLSKALNCLTHTHILLQSFSKQVAELLRLSCAFRVSQQTFRNINLGRLVSWLNFIDITHPAYFMRREPALLQEFELPYLMLQASSIF